MTMPATVYYGRAWIRTAHGWVLRPADASNETASDERPSSVSRFQGPSNTSRDENCSRIVKITGSKGQRKLSVCISDFINYFTLHDAVFDLRQQLYLHKLMEKFMTSHLSELSGTSHRQLFKILETMVNYALLSEVQVPRTRSLLECTWNALTRDHSSRIGCKSVWNRHIQTVDNLRKKMDNFVYTEREEDGLPGILDLPKEVIFEILKKLSDHRDIIHFGLTCMEFYHITSSSFLWSELTLHHFNEKQMATFTLHEDFSDGLPWKELFRNCYKKYGLRQDFTDQLVLCSACKTLHWLMVGHTCWCLQNEKTDFYLEPVTPEEIVQIFP